MLDKKTRIRVCLLYEFELGHHAVVAHGNISRVFGSEALSDIECDQLFNCFQHGDISSFFDYPQSPLSDDHTSLVDQRFVEINLTGLDEETRNRYLAANVQTRWFYIGQDGKHYGPNSAEGMLTWLQGNFFPDNVLMKTEHDEQYYPLADWMSVVSDPKTLFMRNINGMVALVNEVNKLRTGESLPSSESPLSQQSGYVGPTNLTQHRIHQQKSTVQPTIIKPRQASAFSTYQQSQQPTRMLLQPQQQQQYSPAYQQQAMFNTTGRPTQQAVTTTTTSAGGLMSTTMMQPQSFAVVPAAAVNLTPTAPVSVPTPPTAQPMMMMRGHFAAAPPGAVAMYPPQQPSTAYHMMATTGGFASSPTGYCLAPMATAGGFTVGN